MRGRWLLLSLLSYSALAVPAGDDCRKALTGTSAAVMEIARLTLLRGKTSDPAIRSVLLQNILDKRREFRAVTGRPIWTDEIRDAIAAIEKSEAGANRLDPNDHKSKEDSLRWELQSTVIKESLLPPGYIVSSPVEAIETADHRVKVLSLVFNPSSTPFGIFLFELDRGETGVFIGANAPVYYSSASETAVVGIKGTVVHVYHGETGAPIGTFDARSFPGGSKVVWDVEAYPYEGADGKLRIIARVHGGGAGHDFFEIDPVTGSVRFIRRLIDDMAVYVSSDRKSVYVYGVADDRREAFVVDLLDNKLNFKAEMGDKFGFMLKEGITLFESRDRRLFLGTNFKNEDNAEIWDVRSGNKMTFPRDREVATTGGRFLESARGEVLYLPKRRGSEQAVINLNTKESNTIDLEDRNFERWEIFDPANMTMLGLRSSGSRNPSLVNVSLVTGARDVKELTGIDAGNLIASYVTTDGVFGLLKTETQNLSLVRLYGPPPEVKP